MLIFAVTTGAGQLHSGDIFMLLAVLLAAMGYAEGGRLARELDGWRVVSWALVLSLPFSLVAVLVLPGPSHMPSFTAWAAFGYVSVVSMFLAFFAWYRGLALGGVARAGQVQLVQPVLWSALLEETLDFRTVAAALLVVGCAALSRLTR
ncbi:DMT family transporter [Deinococcus roseus]|uniref:DMT family transporter n=1 Tax=Deinococcus roseus TaxID=392414 RepID=UPI00166AC6F0|nr:DMT family transporter [Deinococcus roseus]